MLNQWSKLRAGVVALMCWGVGLAYAQGSSKAGQPLLQRVQFGTAGNNGAGPTRLLSPFSMAGHTG